MQKNIVVHNENRNLEDSMAEMEKELVDVKMQWATVSCNPVRCWALLTSLLDQRRARSAQAKVEQHFADDEVSPIVGSFCIKGIELTCIQHASAATRWGSDLFCRVDRPLIRF